MHLIVSWTKPWLNYVSLWFDFTHGLLLKKAQGMRRQKGKEMVYNGSMLIVRLRMEVSDKFWTITFYKMEMFDFVFTQQMESITVFIHLPLLINEINIKLLKIIFHAQICNIHRLCVSRAASTSKTIQYFVTSWNTICDK